MPGLTDFLFNGTPPAAVTTYGSSSTGLPQWFSDYSQALAVKANALATSNPYTPYTGARIASFTPNQQQAYSNVADLASQYQNKTDSSGNITGGAYAPAFNQIQSAGQQSALGASPQAQSAFNNALQINPYQTAQPGLNAAITGTAQNAGQNTYSGVQNYLNPYVQNVVSEVGRLGQERLAGQESNIRDQFIRGGSFGGSRMGGALGAARRASMADISGQQAGLLSSGYQQAMSQQNQDLQRQLQAYGQAGQLAGQQGALAGQTQQAYGTLGQNLGALSQADLQRRLTSGNALAGLSAQAAQSALQQNAALEASGAQQQNLAQQSLSTAYQDFQNQINYPSQQLSFMNSILRGLPTNTQTTVSSTAPAQSYGASPLSQLGSLAAGAGSLLARNP